MNEGGRFHRRHLLAEARRHLALVLRGRRRDPGLDNQFVAAAISTHNVRARRSERFVAVLGLPKGRGRLCSPGRSPYRAFSGRE
ncbi:hypothetical protein OG524_37005 (plasmid) [Streptomyces sp. NBC_01520]|uniref:hypothetical protein n=1 Tax=Streptomyces sp. NBC_01520 TaxID=2903892 RepID=UPI00386C9C92